MAYNDDFSEARSAEAPQDFSVSKFVAYKGPNYYLDRAALVCNVFIAPGGKSAGYYVDALEHAFPDLGFAAPEFTSRPFERVIDVFAETVMQILRMDIGLPLKHYAISYDAEYFVLAVEYWDEYVAEDSIHAVSALFQALDNGEQATVALKFREQFAKLQKQFDRTVYGGPTISSLLEAAMKLNIPFFYLRNEGDFQWGYGKKQVRGKSTVFHTDGIKDTEFTTLKDAVKYFLLDCGFPTPIGKNCFTLEELLAEVQELGFPLVVKPLAGHKGQGVTTDIRTPEEATKAFQAIVQAAQEAGTSFDGAIVEQQVYGHDHRLLAVNGKFAAALLRVPAFVVGDGTATIGDLIEKENTRPERRDNARSPLAKITIDDGLVGYLALSGLTLDSVPKANERVYLRRVANISVGGVSINVTPTIHPNNIQLVEDIAKFFKVNCLGIDVLAQDITKPWQEGNFAIIEINAGPGIFMHIAPAEGGSVDVPQMIMRSHFPKERSERIPIIAGNYLSQEFCQGLYEQLRAIKPDVEFGALTSEGVAFNGRHFHKHKRHEQNVRIILRNPKLDIACFQHTKDNIFDDGTFHVGADITILDNPHYAEEILKRDTLPDGITIEVHDEYLALLSTALEPRLVMIPSEQRTPRGRQLAVLQAITPLLADLLVKYDT
jgi:cyanophycin synthetase